MATSTPPAKASHRRPTMVVELLPAQYGDAILVECHNADGKVHRILIDAGTPATADVVRDRLRALQVKKIDLMVVSHIDADHIGGSVELLADEGLGVEFDDIWFNGRPQVMGGGRRRAGSRGVADGNWLTKLLDHRPWNEAFKGGPVVTEGAGRFEVIKLPFGAELTLLSPTPKQLTALAKTWTKEEQRLAEKKSNTTAERRRDRVPPKGGALDVRTLAESPTPVDASRPNGSSIAFLLEHRGVKALFGADAYGDVLGAATWELAGGKPLAVDLFKLPHHGSQSNVTDALLTHGVHARHYAVSTSGAMFQHPDAPAIARVIARSPRGAELWFNYESDFTHPWESETLRERFGYAAHYPTARTVGARIELARSTRQGSKSPTKDHRGS